VLIQFLNSLSGLYPVQQITSGFHDVVSCHWKQAS